MSEHQGAEKPSDSAGASLDEHIVAEVESPNHAHPAIKYLKGFLELIDKNFPKRISRVLKQLVLLLKIFLPSASIVILSITVYAKVRPAVFNLWNHSDSKPAQVATDILRLDHCPNQPEQTFCKLSDCIELPERASKEIHRYIQLTYPKIQLDQVYLVGPHGFLVVPPTNHPNEIGRINIGHSWQCEFNTEPLAILPRQIGQTFGIGLYPAVFTIKDQLVTNVWFLRYGAPLDDPSWVLPAEKQSFWQFEPQAIRDEISARSGLDTAKSGKYYNIHLPGCDSSLQPGLFVEYFRVSGLSGSLGVAFTKHYVFLLPRGPGLRQPAVNVWRDDRSSSHSGPEEESITFNPWSGLNLDEGTHEITLVVEVSHLPALNTDGLRFCVYIDDRLVIAWSDQAFASPIPFMPELRNYDSPNLRIQAFRYFYIGCEQ